MDKEASFTLEPESKAVDISQVGAQLDKEDDTTGTSTGTTDWKQHARTWESRAKDSDKKVKELQGKVDALEAQAAKSADNDKVSALQARVASLEADLAEKEFDNLFNQAVQSSGALHLTALKDGLNRAAFRADDGSWDSGKLNSYIASLVPNAPAAAPVSPGLPQNFSQGATPSTKDEVASGKHFADVMKKKHLR